jgi:hypothetical protein
MIVAPADNRFREETALEEGYDERPGLPPAPQLPADLNAREQACEFGECRHDDGAHAVDDQPGAAQKEYQKEAPGRAPDPRLSDGGSWSCPAVEDARQLRHTRRLSKYSLALASAHPIT